MKSDVIHISNERTEISDALKQAEAVAVYKSLSKKDSIHLLLLAEEMMGMLEAMTGEHEADFWIEDDDKTFYLHLKTKTEMNTELRNKLLAASTSGENIAAKGVMGKIRDIFNRLVEPVDSPIPREYTAGFSSSNLSTIGAASVAKNMSIAAVNIWSFNRYKSEIEDSGEAWDELEQSIVASIADEIEIGISDNSVEMVIIKKF